MSAIIRFENVSKLYNLGLTRISLLTLISQWIKSALGRDSQETNQEKFFYALNNVSFELGKGESLALIGPNGAGKTTILKLLSQITKPTSGHIETKGKLSALIELGAGFHPDLTGRENIYLNGTILGLKREEIKRRFDEIVAFAELERFIDTPVKRYSSGMTVRLGFSVASFIEPEILLVDEVLAVGDASFRQKCIERIKMLLQNGTSLIFVSHNLELAKAVCSSAIYIEHGEVHGRGVTSEVIDDYNRVLEKRRAEKLDQLRSGPVEAETDIEISKIEILGIGNQPANDLRSDQPAKILIHYIAYRSIGPANILVRIYRTDEVSCCLMRTSHDGYPITIQQGQGVVSVTLEPNQLYGGTYFAVAWVMDSADINGMARGSSAWFQVNNPITGLNPQDGVFEPHRSWSHHRS